MALPATLLALKAQGEAREAEQKRCGDRRRSLLVLMLQYCYDIGYTQTAAALQQEAGSLISKYEIADNVDLMTILQEFEAYHEVKFGRKPRLTRKRVDVEDGPSLPRIPSSSTVGSGKRSSSSSSTSSKKGVASPASPAGQEGASPKPPPPGELSVKGVGSRSRGEQQAGHVEEDEVRVTHLKPLPSELTHDPELRLLAGNITREILQKSPGVRWDDIVGLDQAKSLLREAVVMPVLYPQIFRGLLSPWGGVLLFGPPGTGKTMLARAVASQCRTTFFNISASSIVSKYRGDSEKLVRVLFDLARHHAPSTIFIDEIDSIMGQRGGMDGASEHEGSLRMKTELLVQMDGLAKSEDALIFVLAASNIPWNLDIALLRRLEKRVMVPLPNLEARRVMLNKLLMEQHATAPNLDLDKVALATEGYSGADIRLVCKEAAMRPVRRLMAKLDGMGAAGAGQSETLLRGVSKGDVKAAIECDPVTMADLEAALASTKRSAHFLAEKYVRWEKEYGAT